MEVIKKLGNNAAICKDNSGRELIALGLGIGFPKCPYILDVVLCQEKGLIK